LVSKVPVILVGNKIDLRGGEVTNEALEEEIVPIMNEFKVIAIKILFTVVFLY
jgi:GTPase SAR1 family protein